MDKQEFKVIHQDAPTISMDLVPMSSLLTLTHYVQVLPSDGNQSTDLQSKSIDWFLYEGNTGT